MLTTILASLLAVGGGNPADLPSEQALCSLADALVVWSPPVPGEGCVSPLAKGCGGKLLVASDGRPVVRFRYKGDKNATWAYPKSPCSDRGVWLYRTDGQMPAGAGGYLQVYLDRISRREIRFNLSMGSPPDTIMGCGEFNGIARYARGRWRLFLTGFRPYPNRPLPENPKCHFTKEEVLDCTEGGPTWR